MIYKPEYFDLEELVCPDVFNKFGQQAWSFFDDRFLLTLDTLRRKLNRPIFINDWKDGGKTKESGLRCSLCDLVTEKTHAGIVYCSAHIRGQAADFHVQGMLPEETRQWIVKNKMLLPFPVRLENAVNWVHLDIAPVESLEKVTFFNAQ